MKKIIKIIFWGLVILFVLMTIGSSDKDKNKEQPSKTSGITSPQSEVKYTNRPFRMGFTRWPPDLEPEAIEKMYRFIDKHGDLIAHHFDNGIPWQEAYDNKPYSEHLMNDWNSAKSNTPRGHKVLVSITPFDSSRENLAKYWGKSDNQNLEDPWKDLRLNDPMVKTAYLNYAKKVANFFDPDYLAIGIEVNIAITKDKNRWAEYKDLHQYVYTELKKSHPSLPIFASISLSHLDGLEGGAKPKIQKEELQSFMKYNDIVSLSTYPYGFAGRVERPAPEDMFDSALVFGKPIAISETGEPSQEFRSLGFKYSLSEDDQAQYIDLTLRKGEEYKFLFIVNWEAIDSDKLLEKFPVGLIRDLGRLYAYLGFEKSDGTPKKALAIWDKYLKLPYKAP